MGWVAAGLVLLFLMLRFPKFGLAVLGAAVLGSLYLYVENERSSRETEQLQKEAQSLERLRILKLEDAKLALDGVLSKAYGSITNESDYQTVTSFKMKVLVYDCPDRQALDAKCTVVGDDEETIYVEVPPRQKRSFESFFGFRDLPRMGPDKWSWQAILREVHIRQP